MSAQVDGYANEHEQAALQKHLRECADCRRYAADLRGLRAGLQMLETPQLVNPAVLTAQIQAALQMQARQAVTRRADLLELWRVRLMSQAVGAFVSVVMFIGVAVGVFAPAYRLLGRVTQSAFVEVEPDPQIALKVLLLQPPPPPVFNPSDELLELGQKLPEGEELIATVTVNNKSGHASLNQVVESPQDPSLVNRLSNLLVQQASFYPASPTRSTSTEAVLMFAKMTVSD